MESLQAVYSSLQAVHGNLVQSVESLQAVYSSLQAVHGNLVSLWRVYRQSIVA